MASKKHLELLEKGYEAFNEYRKNHPRTKIDLSNHEFHNLDLSYYDLSRADLSESTVDRCNLKSANLTAAKLFGTRFDDASLYRANLTDCKVDDDTGFDDVNLSEANLTGVDLSFISICNANLSCIDQVIFAGTPNSWTCFGWLQEGYLAVRAGCRNKRLQEAYEYWSNRHDRQEVFAALKYIEAVAVASGWSLEPVAVKSKRKSRVKKVLDSGIFLF